MLSYWEGEPVIRSQSVKRFPIRVLYYIADAELMVVAFAHSRREPGYWKSRL